MSLSNVVEKKRYASPTVAPQALAYDSENKQLWMSSRDLRRMYAIDPVKWSVTSEVAAPGIPWAAVKATGALRVTIGLDPDDDRYIYRFAPGEGFSEAGRITCPELTGSYLSWDGQSVYLSQWYNKCILKMDEEGKVERIIEVGAEICGHTFVDGIIYVLRGVETPNEDWRIARLDPKEAKPAVTDLAVVPFACRSLAWDGSAFWSNFRANNETISFTLPV